MELGGFIQTWADVIVPMAMTSVSQTEGKQTEHTIHTGH